MVNITNLLCFREEARRRASKKVVRLVTEVPHEHEASEILC